MSALEQPSRDRPRRRSRRPWRRILLVAALAVILFAVGVAFGMALRDDPEPGGIITQVRTLEPLEQQQATP